MGQKRSHPGEQRIIIAGKRRCHVGWTWRKRRVKLLCREQVSESGRGAGRMSWLVLDRNSALLLRVEGTTEESSRKLKREEKGCENHWT